MVFSERSKTGTPACEFWISEGYRISGGANGVDQLRLDVVHAGQTVSAGRVLFSRHAEFFFYHGFTQMDTDGFAFFPSLIRVNQCSSVVPHFSFFYFFYSVKCVTQFRLTRVSGFSEIA